MPGSPVTSAELDRIAQEHVEVMPLISKPEIEGYWRVAKALAASKMFKNTFQAEQCFAKILIGRDLGISPTQAMMSIDLVKGNVQLRGVLLASFVQRHPDYSYRVLEATSEGASVEFLGYPQSEQEEGLRRHRGMWWEVLGVETFTVADARRAGLVKEGGAWEAHPKNMCVWRAVSNGVKFYAPELLGGMPIYVEGELDHLRAPAASPTAAVQSAAVETPPDLPTEVLERLRRASAIDPTRWRIAEVQARVPLASDEAFAPMVAALVAEMDEWLAEHEPDEAEVVNAEPVVGNAGDIAQTDTSDEAEGDAGDSEAEDEDEDDLAVSLQKRWDTDKDWREKVDKLLHRMADLESSLDEVVAEGGGDAEQHLRDELTRVESDMDALGVPSGWWPGDADGQ